MIGKILCELGFHKQYEFTLDRKSNLEVQYAEIVKQLQTTFGPLPDNASLSQPSPYKIFPTVVTYGAYEEPIVG